MEQGGLGVDAAHDILVACSRLARGDAATTIGVSMHLGVVLNLQRAIRMARRQGRAARAEALSNALGAMAWTGTVISSAVSEPDRT